MWSGESHGSNVSNTNNNNGMDVCNDFVISSDTNDESDARDECTNVNNNNGSQIDWLVMKLRMMTGLTSHGRMMELMFD